MWVVELILIIPPFDNQVRGISTIVYHSPTPENGNYPLSQAYYAFIPYSMECFTPIFSSINAQISPFPEFQICFFHRIIHLF